jgi:hypothetical protein
MVGQRPVGRNAAQPALSEPAAILPFYSREVGTHLDSRSDAMPLAVLRQSPVALILQQSGLSLGNGGHALPQLGGHPRLIADDSVQQLQRIWWESSRHARFVQQMHNEMRVIKRL